MIPLINSSLWFAGGILIIVLMAVVRGWETNEPLQVKRRSRQLAVMKRSCGTDEKSRDGGAMHEKSYLPE